ncbi:MAG TPA: hypothetical protein VGE15_11095 [Sphingobacteriaceae bacterium]
MKNNMLCPYPLKKWGWIIAVPSMALGLAFRYLDFSFEWLTFPGSSGNIFDAANGNLTDELAFVGSIAGLSLVAFSAERFEDEYVAFQRLKSLQWAVYMNYAVLLLAVLTIYGGDFLDVLVYNVFIILIIFIARFQFVLYRSRSVAS